MQDTLRYQFAKVYFDFRTNCIYDVYADRFLSFNNDDIFPLQLFYSISLAEKDVFMRKQILCHKAAVLQKYFGIS